MIRASVTSIHRNRRDLPLRVTLEDRTELYGDEVVLAVGNPPPRRLGVAEALAGHPGYVEDPWTLSAMTGHGERLFLIGTGLTMVDAVLAAALVANSEDLPANLDMTCVANSSAERIAASTGKSPKASADTK